MPYFLYSLRFSLVTVACLSGCAVYVPTVPSTPLLEKGQVEVTAGLRSLRTGEVGAAWSPVPHVLLTGELAADIGRSSSTTTNGQGTTTYYDSHHQGSVGLGVYRAPTATTTSYLALMGGVGWGATNFFAYDDYQAASVFFPFPVPTKTGVYDARYRRYYGQFYCAAPVLNGNTKGGVSLRTVFVDYSRLTYADQPILPSNRFFLEPSAFIRSGNGPLRFYLTAGFSAPFTSDKNNPANNRTASWSLLVSGGIILRPDLLGRHRE